VADVPVEVRALGGPPGHVLVDQSRDADLLVVGHRGRGGFRSAVLGSVGLQCVLHASVPVTVVRLSRSPARPGTNGRKPGPRPAAPVLGTFDMWAWALGLLPRTCPSDHAGGMTVTAGREV
jgi:hypothetical protein